MPVCSAINRPHETRAVVLMEWKKAAANQSCESAVQTWTRTFACLASSFSSQLQTPAERVTLALNNLGGKKKEFPRSGNGTQVHQCIVNREQFPQLDHRGTYSILRTTSESGRSRDLMQIPMPSAGFSVDYLKSVLGQAKAYLRPLQRNIPLKDNEKVRNFQHANIIQ